MATVVTSTISPKGSPMQCASPGGGRGPALEGISLHAALLCHPGRSAAGPVEHTRTHLPSSLFSHVPAVTKPERPSRAPIKDASIPTTTHVPMTQVRAGSRGLETAISTQIPCDSGHSPAPATLISCSPHLCLRLAVEMGGSVPT